MKVLVTATNYSKYCQPGKKLLEEAGCEIIENPYGRPYTFEELKEIEKEISEICKCDFENLYCAQFALYQ